LTSRASSSAGDATAAFVSWLVTGAIGPALVALPVNLVADKLSRAAVGWFKRLRQTDDLSRLVRAASGTSVHLNRDEVSKLRSLLTREQTWRMLAGRKLNEKLQELTGQIVGCLPARDGRTEEDACEAAGAIARGLLEFAVYDLQPEIFQKVVLARLQQMTDQASALDTALLRMHKDLYHLAGEAKELFRQVMDRLPPGPADLNEIRIYLKMLISWLNVDSWTRDQRLGGRELTPAAIECELQVEALNGKQLAEAGDLARKCRRLVLLGGPGSGKTWLVKRIARRCAEDALKALTAGEALDKVELPLYCTCSHLVESRGDIRQAAVSGVFDYLPDLGGSRISSALREFFAERNAPTLLVIDSLDEARGSGERLRQADTLPWRIVLTSRDSSWNHQLAINNEPGASESIGILQSLRYPGDVESFVTRWFQTRPEGESLIAQLAWRPSLQQAATVPLILAFYCIVSDAQLLPEFRHRLFRKVVRRLLTGRWRDGHDAKPDVDNCLRVLREWAWSGATSDPVSGIGTWADDIPVEHVRLGEADEDALDHIAAPLGLPSFDDERVLRRFVHRSIREHLVAEHIARMPADEALEALLPHIWYDPDWTYVAPAAIGMHPQHDQILRALLCRVARSDQIPEDLSAIDSDWQVREFLARIATESGENEWSPEIAALIDRTRVEFAQNARVEDILGATAWNTSNHRAREALLSLLPEQPGWVVADLARCISQLAPTAEDQRETRTVLLGLLASQTDGQAVAGLAKAIAQLAPTADEQRQARAESLAMLVSPTNGLSVFDLADAAAQLSLTDDEQHEARAVLLGLLASQTDGLAVAGLANAIAQLAPTADEQRQACAAILRMMRDQTDGEKAATLASGVSPLAPTVGERREASAALLGLLVSQTGAFAAMRITDCVIELARTADEQKQARMALLDLLATQLDVWMANSLARAVAQLGPTTSDRHRARVALLNLLSSCTDGFASAWLADMVVRLTSPGDEQRQVRTALLRLLIDQTNGLVAAGLARAIAQLVPTADEQQQARTALLSLLAGQNDSTPTVRLAEAVVQLAATAKEITQARKALLGQLTYPIGSTAASELASMLSRLDPPAAEQQRARDALLELLLTEPNQHNVGSLMSAIAKLNPAIPDLSNLRSWTFPISGELLATVRRNSTLSDWLEAIPSLKLSSGRAATGQPRLIRWFG
jgi:NACHT domain